MKRLFVIIIAIAVLVFGYFKWRAWSNEKTASANQQVSIPVERGSIRLDIASTAQVVSNLDVDIMSKASGEIIKLPFDVSDPVKKGDLLVEIDPVDEQRNVRQAKVSLESAQAKLSQAQENLKTAEREVANNEETARANIRLAEIELKDAKAKAERMRKLFENSRVSVEDYETAQNAAEKAEVALQNAQISRDKVAVQKEALEIKRQDVTLAKADLEKLQISLEIAEQRLSETKVIAPIAGVISKRNVQVGQIVVSPTGNVSGGTVLMTISDLSRIFILASVDESDIGSVAIGQNVEITADAFQNDKFEGTVTRIATRGTNVSNVVTFEVKIEVATPNKTKLKPMMTTNVEIIAAQKENVLLLPSEAVQRKGDERFVMLAPDSPSAKNAKDAQAEPGVKKPTGQAAGVRHKVVTGIDNGTFVEIVSGLADGDKITATTEGLQSKWSKQGSTNRRGMMPPPM